MKIRFFVHKIHQFEHDTGQNTGTQDCCVSQATAAAVDTFSMVYSRTLKTSFSKFLQHRLDLTSENLRIIFEGHYTLIGRNMSRKFQIPLSDIDI